MLNISKNAVRGFDFAQYKSGKKIFDRHYYKAFNKFLIVFFVALVVVLFLPWTQNVSGRGYVTTLSPDKRPQSIQSQIPGRIEQWFVQEGDMVSKGDTIMRISEVKSEYFDTELVQRTTDQLMAKKEALEAYDQKAEALRGQIIALEQERGLKLSQSRTKVEQTVLKAQSDSLKLIASQANIEIARIRMDREKSLFEQGLKSAKEVESRTMNLRSAEADFVGAQNNYVNTNNQVSIDRFEIQRIDASYADKIAKTKSDLASARSARYEAAIEVSKLENILANYRVRRGLQFIVAPQDGFINKAIKGGIGETFKEGESLVSIMPMDYALAVETYVRPIDMPLLHIGEKVRVEFDGWPAIVFSGWPNASLGTYGAQVVAMDRFISENNMYRILLAPDFEDRSWPEQIRVGSGARTIALLSDVPIWFELWRQLNGFPPNYYAPENGMQDNKNK
jgi:adhesin transport system membrane fusion protein